MDEQYFFVRTSRTQRYAKGYGNHAVPKLYQLGQAKRVRNDRNKRVNDVDDLWEVVPAYITIGEPVE